MHLQNRVTPFGVLESTPAKGLFMGNRGILHDERGELNQKRWVHKNWVTCALNFKDYNRKPRDRKPDKYTELIFLDEQLSLPPVIAPVTNDVTRISIFFSFAGLREMIIRPKLPSRISIQNFLLDE